MSNKKKSKNYHTRMFVADTAAFMDEILNKKTFALNGAEKITSLRF